MSWEERDYAHDDYTGGPRPGRVRYHGSGLETLSVTTSIIIANVVVFLLTTRQLWDLAAMRADLVWHGQIWRLFTATYLHAGFEHIFINMLFLYFIGPALERVWGPRQFFLVYTIGGIAGNVVLTLAGVVGFIRPDIWGVGASGCILTLLGAAAVLFPAAEIYVYFLFPISIRTFTIIYASIFVLNIFSRGVNYGGDICHLVGLVIGVWWAHSGGWSLSGRHRTTVHPSSILNMLLRQGPHLRQPPGPPTGPYRHRPQEDVLDAILEKVHQQGVASLSQQEKEILAAATRREDGK